MKTKAGTKGTTGTAGTAARAEVEKVIDRLSKLKSLSERGVGGEKENARALLEIVAKKWGIDLDNLPGAEEERDFSIAACKGWRVRLLCQLMGLARVEKYGNRDADHCFIFSRSTRGGKKHFFARCTALEWAEVQAKYSVLSRDYEEQIGAFYRAFLIANDLLLEARPDDKAPTEKELEESRLALRVSAGIKRSDLRKQIEGGGGEEAWA